METLRSFKMKWEPIESIRHVSKSPTDNCVANSNDFYRSRAGGHGNFSSSSDRAHETLSWLVLLALVSHSLLASTAPTVCELHSSSNKICQPQSKLDSSGETKKGSKSIVRSGVDRRLSQPSRASCLRRQSCDTPLTNSSRTEFCCRLDLWSATSQSELQQTSQNGHQ